MLQSHLQTTIRLPERQELKCVAKEFVHELTVSSEQQIQAEQQSLVLALSARTLSLQVGHAMFAYRTERLTPTEAARGPALNMSAKVLPTNATMSIDLSSVPAERRLWPEFHAGVGAALRMVARPGGMDSSQITFQRSGELDARFAGFLLGLGLTGHIRSMAVVQAFKFLDPKHEYTSIGVLLGLAAAYMGTGDAKVTSVLSVHLTALHPANSSTLNISLATQTAGLLGIGLLYLGTGTRRYSGVMTRELARMHVVGTEHPDGCREAYALAAGFAFGMIMLGRGRQSDTLADAELLRIFRGLIVGDGVHALPGTKEACHEVDVAVTSPAATAALALMYLDSGRTDVLEMLEIPQSAGRLDYVRNDLVTVRTLARGLIRRSSILPTHSWVESQVPVFIRHAMAAKSPPSDIELAYWHVVGGACLAMALKYAGTANREAHLTLINYLDRVIRMNGARGASISADHHLTASVSNAVARARRLGVRACCDAIVLAVAAVMAGTGEIHTLRRLRVLHGQVAEGVPFGTHMSTHMAIGLLFLGGGRYTLSTSPAATAALLCALWPAMPSSSGDNRAHIQAARHLWVLATEPRCLVARDIETEERVILPVKIRTGAGGNDGGGGEIAVIAPTLVPELEGIEVIAADSPRYWPVTLPIGTSARHRAAFVRDRTLFVKRRHGHLPYKADPRGTKGLFSRPGVETGAVVFDSGRSGELVEPDAMQQRPDDPMVGFMAEHDAIATTRHLCRRTASVPTPADDSSDARFAAFHRTTLLECLSLDKGPSALAAYRSVFIAFRDVDDGFPPGPAAMGSLRSVRFVTTFYGPAFHHLLGDGGGNEDKQRELLGSFFIQSLIATLRSQLSLEWPAEDTAALETYARTQAWPTDEDRAVTLARNLQLADAPDAATLAGLRQAIGRSGLAREAARLVLKRAMHAMWSGHHFCLPDTHLLDALLS